MLAHGCYGCDDGQGRFEKGVPVYADELVYANGDVYSGEVKVSTRDGLPPVDRYTPLSDGQTNE